MYQKLFEKEKDVRKFALIALLVLGVLSPTRDVRLVVAETGGCSQIVVANGDGSNQQTVTSAGSNASPRWNADGSKILFASDRAGGSDIYVLSLKTKQESRLTRSGDVYDADWDNTGSKVVISHNFGKLTILKADGTGVVRSMELPGIFLSQPRWSPDGKWIAAWGQVVNTSQSWMYLVPAAGGTPTKISGQEGVKNWYPTWKTSSLLSYVSMRADGNHLVTFDLQTQIGKANAPVNGLMQPDWSKDGKKLAYSWVYNPGAYALVSVENQVLAIGGNAAWSPGGQLAFVAYSCTPDGWMCAPVFYPMDIAGVDIHGKEVITFTTTLASNVTKLEHSPSSNLQKEPAKVWRNPGPGAYSSTWKVQDILDTSVGVTVTIASQFSGGRDAEERFDCFRTLFHIATTFVDQNGNVNPISGTVEIEGLNLHEELPMVDGVARRLWLPEGVYTVTPKIEGKVRTDLTKQLLLLGRDASIQWTLPTVASAPGGGSKTGNSRHTLYVPWVSVP